MPAGKLKNETSTRTSRRQAVVGLTVPKALADKTDAVRDWVCRFSPSCEPGTAEALLDADRSKAVKTMASITQRNASIPVEIGRANQHDVRIAWHDGHVSVYPARELRLACPCAACVDEVTGQIRLLPANVPQNVYPLKIELVGRYAISIQWSDGHNTGIYAFDRLRKMGLCKESSKH